MMINKILFVITGLGVGGAEKQVCLLADKLSELGHHVKIISLVGAPDTLPQNKEIEVHNLYMRKNPSSIIQVLMTMKRIVKDYSPDVIHGHMFHANIFTRFLKLISNDKVYLVNTAHSNNEGGKLRMLVYRFTDPLCDVTTNVSVGALDAFYQQRAFKVGKSITVYNGIDLTLFCNNKDNVFLLRDKFGLAKSDIVLLAVGRLTKAKDYPTLIKAVSHLPNNYKLFIIGEGPERQNIETLINEKSLGGRVNLMGKINDVHNYYSACDLFVISSAWEGFGLVVAEAMASEKIVIGTNAGGIKEVIGNESYVVPAADELKLASKIEDVFKLNLDERQSIAVNNRKLIINKFDINSIIDKWIEIYVKLQER